MKKQGALKVIHSLTRKTKFGWFSKEVHTRKELIIGSPESTSLRKENIERSTDHCCCCKKGNDVDIVKYFLSKKNL